MARFVSVFDGGIQSPLVGECRAGSPSTLRAAVPRHRDVFAVDSGRGIVMLRVGWSVFGRYVRAERVS